MLRKYFILLLVCMAASCVKVLQAQSCYTADAGADRTICSGSNTTLGTGSQSGYTYSWLPTTALDDANIAQPTASPTSTNLYRLTMTPNNNLITNPGFESGNTGFTSDYVNFPNVMPGASQHGNYLVTTSPYQMYNNWCDFPSHNTAGTKMLVADAPVIIGGPYYVWIQTINVSQNTDYYFSGFAAGASGFSGTVRGTITGNVSGTASADASFSAACSDWQQFNTTWNSGSNTQVTLRVYIYSGGSGDYCIDDLYFGTCQQTTDEVVVTVGPATPTVTPAGPITYYNHYENTTSVLLTASAAPSYQWYVNELMIEGATSQTYSINFTGLGSYSLNYYCVTPCGTSNEVEFNYIGCTTNNGYPVSVPTGACMSALTGGNSIALPTVSLGVPTAYSWSFADNPTCLSIGTFGDLTASGCSGTTGNGIVSKSSRGTEELYMFYYFTANGSCRMAAGGNNNGPIKEPAPSPWNEHLTYLTPNPAKYAVTIRSKKALNSIEVYNSAGVLVKTYAGNKQSLVTIGISDLKPGMYMVRLIGTSGVETKKLVVE